MGVLCASDLRPLHTGGIDPLVRAAGDAGATGIHLAGGLTLGDLEGVIPGIVRAGLEVPSMRLPLAPRALGPRLARRAHERARADAKQRAEVARAKNHRRAQDSALTAISALL